MKKVNFEDRKAASLIVPIVLLVLWELAGRTGAINLSLFPSPSRIINAFIRQNLNGNLPRNVFISLERVVIGYLFGAILGIIVGVSLGLSKRAYRLLALILEILRPIPIIAWVPVLIMILGIGEPSKVIVIVIGSFWPIFLNTYDGIKNVNRDYLEVGDVFRKTKWEKITKITVPSALPSIFTGLRLGISSAWVSVIGAELIAASAGLGFMISFSREMAQPANMYLAVLVIGLIGYAINVIILAVQKRILHWI